MREIKFRAWNGSRMFTFDNHSHDLLYNDITGWNVMPNIPCEQLRGLKWTTGESSDTAEKFVLMQFTGLKDKNGKEIYEGDVATWHAGGLDGSGKKGVVKFEDAKFYIDGFYLGFLDNPTDAFCEEGINCFEVIGNIYENPELLKA